MSLTMRWLRVLSAIATLGVPATGGEITAQNPQGPEGGVQPQSLPCPDCPPPSDTVPIVTIVSPSTTVYTRTPVLLVTFRPGGTGPYDGVNPPTITWDGVNVTTLGRANSRLFEWEVSPTYQLSPGGSKILMATVCNMMQHCTTQSLTVTLKSSPWPILSVTPMPLEALDRRPVASLGGGFAVHGAEVTTSLAAPAYVSWNEPRSAGITYSSRQSYPRALVNADLEFPGGLPTSLTVRLWDGPTVKDSLVQTSPTCSSGRQPRCRVTLVATYIGTPGTQIVRKWLRLEVQATINGMVRAGVDSVEAVIVDRRTTPYGSGWWPSGVLRLVTAGSDGVIVAADGSATIYRGYQDQYLSPPGDYSTLVKTAGGWELRFRDGGKLVFDAQGRQTDVYGAHTSWRTTVSYLSTDQVDRITDPAGKWMRFLYTSNVLSALGTADTTVLSPVTISGGLLTRFTPGGLSKFRADFAWQVLDAYKSVLPTSRSDWLGQQLALGYSTRNFVQHITFPTVQDETGQNVQPDAWYDAAELRGLGTVVSLDSVYARSVDPRGFWSATTVNRWGQPLRTWDARGTLATSTYSTEGLVLTTEGKVGDSTRVYYDYDTLGRRIRSRRFLDTVYVRLDSLVWDASHRLTRQYGMLNSQYTSYTYTGWNTVVSAISTLGDTTINTYTAQGRLETRHVAGSQGVTRFFYGGGTWGNTDSVQAPDGATTSRNTYDALGRLLEAQGRTTVRVTSATTEMQWRRRILAYNALGLVDSVRIERTASCPAPCTTPSWPTPGDPVLTRSTRTLYDLGGRPTVLMANGLTLEERAYDALGRLTSLSRPTSTGAMAFETYAYDRAGNLRYRTTRRGHVIETRYDSRGRDSVRIVPGVGTFRMTYGGPDDELTALTADGGFADPVGGSTVNAGWGYDQSGRLRSATVQGSRTTTYTYDGWGRLASLADVTGTWQVRYHATRGTPDTVLTPFADSVVYALDGAGRLIGPTVRTGAWTLARGQVWRATGGLRQLRNDVTGGSPFAAGVHTLFDTDPAAAYDSLSPLWTEVQGSGGTAHTLLDSLQFDGWERLTQVRYLRDGAMSRAEAFRFDPAGNVTIDSVAGTPETWTFASPGQHLLSARGCTFTYDAAGNLTQRVCGGQTTTYTYDALDRLTQVVGPGVSAAWTYDVLGQRIAASVNGAITRFVWRSGHVVYETDNAGALQRSYTWGSGADDLVAITDHTDGNRRYYVVQDAIRSVRGLVRRESGGSLTWVAAYRYTAYGQPLSTDGGVGFPLRFRWAGAMYDEETGLYFLRTRSYDPRFGRFIQADLAGFAGGSNLYAYADGDPTSGRDPSGMMSVPEPQYHSDYDLSTYGAWMDLLGGRASGGSWHPGEGFEGSMITPWDLWSVFERNSLYQQYSSNYEAFRSTLRSDLPSGGVIYSPLYDDLKALDRNQFFLVMSSVSQYTAQGGDLGQRVWDNFVMVARQGGFALDVGSNHTSPSHPGVSYPTFRRQLPGVSAINPVVLTWENRAHIADVFIHESLHISWPFPGPYPPSHGAICAVAFSLTGWAHQCN